MSRACGIDLKHDRFSDRGNAEHASLPAHLSTVVAAPVGRDTRSHSEAQGPAQGQSRAFAIGSSIHRVAGVECPGLRGVQEPGAPKTPSQPPCMQLVCKLL
jgi:hypothetical protein